MRVYERSAVPARIDLVAGPFISWESFAEFNLKRNSRCCYRRNARCKVNTEVQRIRLAKRNRCLVRINTYSQFFSRVEVSLILRISTKCHRLRLMEDWSEGWLITAEEIFYGFLYVWDSISHDTYLMPIYLFFNWWKYSSHLCHFLDSFSVLVKILGVKCQFQKRKSKLVFERYRKGRRVDQRRQKFLKYLRETKYTQKICHIIHSTC